MRPSVANSNRLPIASIHVTFNPQGGIAKRTLHYLHSDHLDTPRQATDQNRKTLWRWKSDAFGVGKAVGSATINLRFPGQYFDQETGLHYNYFRDYDPQTGRYVESDPIGLDGGLNTYGYMSANPVSWTDPFGLARCTYLIAEHTMCCFPNNGGEGGASSTAVHSGREQCKNNPSTECTSNKDNGPIPAGTYNLEPNNLPGRAGWWAAQSTEWNSLSGLSCRLGYSRCGFNIHLGSYSLGCMTFDINTPQGVKDFSSISNLLQNDAPNTLIVYPNNPSPGL